MHAVPARNAGKPDSGFATREMFSPNKASCHQHGNRLTRDAHPRQSVPLPTQTVARRLALTDDRAALQARLPKRARRLGDRWPVPFIAAVSERVFDYPLRRALV